MLQCNDPITKCSQMKRTGIFMPIDSGKKLTPAESIYKKERFTYIPKKGQKYLTGNR